jgi:tripartite-type tricarboxylate transporter receptor subunit TctC
MTSRTPRPGRRAVLAAATLLPYAARAQSWAPSRLVRIIVPFAPGGVADLTVRTVGTRLAERIGQPVIVDNRPSAGGIVAAQQLMAAPADGHTLLTTTNGPPSRAASSAPCPTTPCATSPTSRSSRLPDRGRRRAVRSAGHRGAAGAAAGGARAAEHRHHRGGSTQNLSAELFRIRTGTRFETITFPATPQLTTALLRGDVDAAFEITGPIKGQIESGALRALAVSSAARATTLPDVPTLREAGVPDYDVSSWNALSLRAGTPAEAVVSLNRAVNEVLAEPATREALTRSGVEVRGGTPDALRDLLATDTTRWAEVIERAGIERQ